jgi:hypothetical protein
METFGVLLLSFLGTWLIIAGVGVLVRLMYAPELEDQNDEYL